MHLLSQYRHRKDEAEIGPHAGAGAGRLVDVCGGRRGRAHQQPPERALGFAGLWRKLRQGTDNEKGDRRVERILSVRETCRLRGGPTFPILVDAVTCYFNG
jgi:hypothetical protein